MYGEKNSEGYPDETACQAIGNVTREERNKEKSKKERERFNKLLYELFDLCNDAGYDVIGRFSVRDRKTGIEHH